MHDLRKKQRRKEVSLDYSLEQNAEDFLFRYLTSHADTEKAALNHIDSQNALRAIQRLEPIIRQVLLCRLVGELSFREIGDILGHTENWARVTFFRGRKKLMEVLTNDGG